MAKFEGAKTSLGGVEDRLRRSLNLAGLIEADFVPQVAPQVVVDDATRPGCNGYRGRKFFAGQALTVPAVGPGAYSIGIKAVNPVIIWGVWLAAADATYPTTVALSAAIEIMPPTSADPFAMTTPVGMFVENPRSLTDRPPLFAGNAAAVVAGTNVGTFNLVGHQSLYVPLDAFLDVGAKLFVEAVELVGLVNVALSVTWKGEIF